VREREGVPPAKSPISPKSPRKNSVKTENALRDEKLEREATYEPRTHARGCRRESEATAREAFHDLHHGCSWDGVFLPMLDAIPLEIRAGFMDMRSSADPTPGDV